MPGISAFGWYAVSSALALSCYCRQAHKCLKNAYSRFQAMQTSGCTSLRASCQVGMLFRAFPQTSCQQQVTDLALYSQKTG